MKKSFLVLFFLLSISVIVTSCHRSPKADEAWIDGELTGNSFSQIVLEELTPDGIQKIDSAAVIHNKFKFKVHVLEPGFYFLRFSATNQLSLLLEPGKKISIQAPADSLGYPLQLIGSEESNQLLALNHALDRCYKTTDSLSKIFKEYAQTAEFDSVKVTIDSAYYTMFYAHKKWLESYIHSHKNSLTLIVAFYQTLGRRSFFSAQDDFKLMEFIDQNLAQVYSKNKHFLKFHSLFLNQKTETDRQNATNSMLNSNEPLAPIILTNVAGKSIDVTKIKAPSKLLVFWNIKSMVDNYEKQQLNTLRFNYQLVGISFEADLEIWKSYIQKEFKNFVHFIDLQGLQGEIAQRFSISATNIPYYILLDSQNKVLKHGKKLSSITGKN